jgi:hypothetical protein
VRDSARAELPPIEKALEAGEALRAKAEADVRAERAALEPQTKEAGERLQTVHRRIREAEEADGKRQAEVEAALTRPLSPAERVQVRRLAALNQTTPNIAAALQKQADDADEKFVKEVVLLLGRALTPEELGQVRRWRREGKNAADVVAVLRKAPAQRAELPLDVAPR